MWGWQWWWFSLSYLCLGLHLSDLWWLDFICNSFEFLCFITNFQFFGQQSIQGFVVDTNMVSVRVLRRLLSLGHPWCFSIFQDLKVEASLDARQRARKEFLRWPRNLHRPTIVISGILLCCKGVFVFRRRSHHFGVIRCISIGAALGQLLQSSISS